MRAVTSIAFVSSLLGVVSGRLDKRAQQNGTDLGPTRYIVEYDQNAAPASFRAPSLSSEDVQVVSTFQSEIFSGASVETTEQSADDLLNLPGVARVWRNRLIQLEPLNLTATFSDDANSVNYSSHHLTNVFSLHERQIFGEGVKIGIVDTGIDYSHPALGGGFGDGFKVASGYDFVGDGNWPDEGEREPDDDPLDHEGHGTHVAGIVAGLSDRFAGVAPEATLYAYKVFAGAGWTDDATLIDAFLRAYEDGVDIITASIGGTNGWQDNPWAVVASRLVDQGVVVTISAGNDGEVGPFYGSSGSSGKNVLAVASTANEVTPAPSFRVNFDHHCNRSTSIVGYIPAVFYFDEDIIDWPIVPISLDTNVTNDACEPFPEGYYNLTGKIPLVRRGGCLMTEKQANLEPLGAQWILIYNNEDPLAQPGQTEYGSYLAMIEVHSGEAIVEAVAANYSVTADFSRGTEEIVGLPWVFAGRASYFSTWGGLNELEFKPDIAAPGGEIFSTYLDGQWTTFSGTSMAAPYVAGVAAMYIGLNGGRSIHGAGFAKSLSRRIISSGNNVKWWDNTLDVDAPPPQVGTGLIDAHKVIDYTSSLDFEPIALNDTANFVSTHQVTVFNNGDEEVEYTFSLEPAKGFELLYPEDDTSSSPRVKSLYELEPVDLTVNVDLPESFTLQAGESKEISVVFETPTFEEFSLPLYSGKILVKSSKNETLSVPYMGLGADLKEEMSDMFMNGYPEAIHLLNWTSIYDNASWSNEVWGVQEDWLYTTVQLKWASRELRWDIYEAGWDESLWFYPPQLGDDGYVGSVAYWVDSATSWWSQFHYAADPTDTLPLPMYDLNRHGIYPGQYRVTFQWMGMLTNGSQLEPGNYTMRLAALKPFGDPSESSDWSIWDAPEISILGKFGPNPYNLTADRS